MAFDPQESKVPTEIGNMVVILKDAITSGEDPAYQSAHFEIKIVMSDGSEVTRRGDLVQHITTVQRQALMGFMNSLRTQAEDQILA